MVKAMADGWRYVLEHQGFALSMPMRCAPAIDAAIKAIEQQGVRAAPQLIEAAAEGARLDILLQWQRFLTVLGGNASGAA